MLTPHHQPTTEDAVLLAAATRAVHQTGQTLLQRFDPQSRPRDMDALLAMIDANDEVATHQLRPLLLALRPQARWLEDEDAAGPLPPGEWWVADPVEGNVNHIHGLAEWSTTVTLVRDNLVVFTVVDEPLAQQVYTALRGQGAFLNGKPLRVSAKSDLQAALVSTGQATPGDDVFRKEQLSRTVSAMLARALLVKTAVPATMQLLHVAAGRLDAFWQAGNVLSGLASGALLVQEAGGLVSDWQGRPWTPASTSFVASAAGLHAPLIDILSNHA